MLGLLVILVPMTATIAFATLIGWLILVSGVVGLLTTFMARNTSRLKIDPCPGPMRD
jgi:uncharacterized membrane protein HdeD (DUF308 family)